MINLDRYLTSTAWLGILGLCCVLMTSISAGGRVGLVLLGTVLMVCLVQVPTALRITFGKWVYPEWLNRGVALYWIAWFGMLVFIFAMIRVLAWYQLVNKVWFYILPCVIMIFQFRLFNRYNTEIEVKNESADNTLEA